MDERARFCEAPMASRGGHIARIAARPFKLRIAAQEQPRLRAAVLTVPTIYEPADASTDTSIASATAFTPDRPRCREARKDQDPNARPTPRPRAARPPPCPPSQRGPQLCCRGSPNRPRYAAPARGHLAPSSGRSRPCRTERWGRWNSLGAQMVNSRLTSGTCRDRLAGIRAPIVAAWTRLQG